MTKQHDDSAQIPKDGEADETPAPEPRPKRRRPMTEAERNGWLASKELQPPK